MSDELNSKSQFYPKIILFNPPEEAKTFFSYTYKDGKRTKVNPKAIEWWNSSVQHLRTHESLNCELCSGLRYFIKSRFVTASEVQKV